MPLGLPVDPDVNRMKSGKDASTGDGRASCHRLQTNASGDAASAGERASALTCSSAVDASFQPSTASAGGRSTPIGGFAIVSKAS
eukprot:3017071-Prymnesium_polylepis.3